MATGKSAKKSYAPSYISTTMPKEVKSYKSTAKAPKSFKLGKYKSKYKTQLNNALDTITNFKYDPMQDASYQALAQVYGARGNIAAKDTLGDAAALNGGFGTSYAVSAAQQARNQYNQELAALIPNLEANAYSRAQGTYNALMDADNTAYGRYRDTQGDRQWKWSQNYQKYRDKVGDQQWQYSQNYNRYRDLMGDYQWGQNYNMDLYQYNQAQAQKGLAGIGSGSGGGGRRSSGSSGGGGAASAYTTNSADTLQTQYDEAKARAAALNKTPTSNLREGTATATFIKKRKTK